MKEEPCVQLNDVTISRAIITSYTEELLQNLNSDVIVVGGGPAGLVAAYYLAKAGKQVVLIERKLSVGGGMWGGGMMFNKIVVQDSALPILDEMGVKYARFEEGYYTAGSVETVAALVLGAVQKGVSVYNLISVEDIMIREEKVAGLVLNWTAVEMGKLHVDPLTVGCRYVIDATGHDAQITDILVRKMGPKLRTASGNLEGEKTMWACRGEDAVVENTVEVFPGLLVAGMAANAVCGGHRMGPIFGGMLLSGQKAAKLILDDWQ